MPGLFEQKLGHVFAEGRAKLISESSSLAEIRLALSVPERTQAVTEHELLLASEIAGNRDIELAVHAMMLLTAREPQNCQWHHRLGHFLTEGGRLERAEAHCLKAIELSPKFADAYHLLGHIRQRAGNLTGALDAVNIREENCGPSVSSSYTRAVLLFELQHFNDALAVVRKINDVGPPTETTLLFEAQVLQQLGKIQTAVNVLERAYRLWPGSAAAATSLGHLLCHLGNYDTAVPVLEVAERLAPSDPSLAYLLAVALSSIGRLRPALEAINRAINLLPAEYEYLYTAAAICDRLGEKEMALHAIRRAIAAAPGATPARLMLAHILGRSGDIDGAVNVLEDAECISPNDHSIRDLKLYLLSERQVLVQVPAGAAYRGENLFARMPISAVRHRGNNQSASILHGLQAQSRVLAALIVRDFKHRTAHSRFGIISIFLPMALQILTLGVVLSLFNNGRPPIGDHLFFFYATGVMPFYLFIHIIDHCQNQFIDNAAILQVPLISRLDIVLAVALTELLIMTAVVAVTFGVFSITSYGPASDNQIQGVFALLAVWLFAFGLGLISAVMTNVYRPWANGWLILQRFLYVASGVFFIPLNMPVWIREPLSWNPILQGIEWFRTGFFMFYDPPWLDKSYLVEAGVGTTVIGLMLERALRRKMKTQ